MLRKYTGLASLALCGTLLTITLATRAGAEVKAPDVIILKGAPLGGVKFTHKEHADKVGGKCDTCHHASKPEKPATAAQQACRDCHTKPPQAGMKTGTQAAFHNPTAKAGTCIDCHLKMNAAEAKKAPTMCGQCHKKTNV
jgi:hypothetical protein